MGSFTSRTPVDAMDDKDETCEIPQLDYSQFIDWIKHHQLEAPPPLPRSYRAAPGRGVAVQNSTPFRILQWNILAQALATQVDNFISCPKQTLEWDKRKYRILEEILYYDPDVICLQEVDHYRFIERALETQGFKGYFHPKPDSPCIYLSENNGPDGCALFYRTERFILKNIDTKILEVWMVQSNQIAILATFEDISTGKEFVVVTTHLKARKGALLSTFRYEQGGDLLRFLKTKRGERPAIICGDFNAEPTEAVYSRMINDSMNLKSSYAVTNDGNEPPYSTWKIRKDGEAKHTIDYIFYSPQFVVEGCVDAPLEKDIGINRVPSAAYPSDHFCLISDFSFYSQPNQDKRLRNRQ